jgi:hypothetical protein
MADLIEMPETKNKNKYILVIVDLATNEFDIEPLKNKSAEDVLLGSKKIFKRSYLKVPYASIRTDNGKEFKGVFQTFCNDNNIFHKTNIQNRHTQLANVDSSLNGRYLGFKAQELKDILPEVVSKPDFDSVYYVNYGQIAALLVEGVKSVNKTVDSLSNKIIELQNSYSNLFNQNQSLNIDLIELKNRMDFCCPPQSNEGAIMGSLNVKNSFKIQPNPVQNVADIILHIEKPNSNIKILLTDLSGKIILSKKYEGINKKNQLDFSNLSNGIYHCSLVIDDNIIETKSIIHEK